MQLRSFSDARANLKDVMDQVVADHEPVAITRARREPVVMVSLSDWNAMETTVHLLSNPRNAQRLEDAIAQLDAGKGQARELLER